MERKIYNYTGKQTYFSEDNVTVLQRKNVKFGKEKHNFYNGEKERK